MPSAAITSLRFVLCDLRGCGFSMPFMWLFYTSVFPSTASYGRDEARWDQPAPIREIRCSPASAPAPASRIARFELWQCGGAGAHQLDAFTEQPDYMHGGSQVVPVNVDQLVPLPLLTSSDGLQSAYLCFSKPTELKSRLSVARGEANSLTALQYGNGPGNRQENSSNFQKRATTSQTSHPQLTGTL
jgi:hypothetical protein